MTGRPPGKHPDQDAIIQAALRCFQRTGWEAATMREIAKESGTSVSRLYMTFESKQALCVAVQQWANRHLLEEYFIPALSEGDLEPWDRVMALVDAYLRFYSEERELATLMSLTPVDATATDPATRALIATQTEQHRQFAKLLGKVTADTGSDLDPYHVVRWVWAALTGMASINVRLPHLAIDEDELDQLVAVGMRLVRAGLRESKDRPPVARTTGE